MGSRFAVPKADAKSERIKKYIVSSAEVHVSVEKAVNKEKTRFAHEWSISFRDEKAGLNPAFSPFLAHFAPTMWVHEG